MGVNGFPADVGVAIVSYNSRDQLGPTLDSLAAAGCPDSAIQVLDVASTDGTDEWLRASHPGISVVRLPRNDGPNPARNLGIRECSRPYVFLMDADVRVQANTIPLLRGALAADQRVKIGSPIVVHRENPTRIQYAGTSLHFICEAINPWVDRTLGERGPEPLDIGVASACGLLIERQAAIDVGLFDERYFMGKDDGDFTYRMRMAGYRIRELPDALVLHESRPRSAWLFYYQIRNRWHFMLKNYQLRTLALILPCLLIHEPLQLVLLHWKGHGGAYWKAVGGLFKMLPSLGRDRAFTNSIRVAPDSELLKGDSLMVRGDLLGNAIARFGKSAYERVLGGYWRALVSAGLVG
jgi:GT2 family glycosyltransferase